MALNLSALLGGGLILKRQLITANGDWVRPERMVGTTVWLTMIGGGASGRRIANVGNGGPGGQWVIQIPVDIGATATVPCTVGAGGAAVAAGVASNPGGPTSFGAFVTMAGGAIGSSAGAPGGVGAATAVRPHGSDTPLGYGGAVLTAPADTWAGGGGGLMLDASGISGGTQFSAVTAALGYGAGGAAANTPAVGNAGAPGAILVEWPEFI